MNNVIFGDINAFEEWGLLLRPKTRPKPSPKYDFVSIPGRNGDLDLTESFGDIFYENLTYSLEFYMVDAMKNWDDKLRTITNALHGKKMKVTFTEDQNYYYLGRVTINELASNRSLGILSIECNFEPYKYKQAITTITQEVVEGGIYTFTNGRLKVVPTITLSSDMTLRFNNVDYALTSGTMKVLGIQFVEGVNTIEIVNGSGTLTLDYQEGDL